MTEGKVVYDSFAVGLVDDAPSRPFNTTAEQILGKRGFSVRASRAFADGQVDVIVVGTIGEITLVQARRTANRIRKLHRAVPSTPVIFSFAVAESMRAETFEAIINAGAVSAVPVKALPTAVANLAASSGLTSLVREPGHRSADPFLVEGAHDPESGRLDAKRLADLLGIPLTLVARSAGVTPSALSKRATSRSAQAGLRELTFIWRTLMNVFKAEGKARAWLHAPRPDLDNAPPLSFLADGTAKDLANYIRRALAGEPA